MEKKNIIINIKKKKFDLNSSDVNSSGENDKIKSIPRIMPDMKFINGMETNNINGKKNKFVNGIISVGKTKDFSKNKKKSNSPIKLNNDINNFGLDDNENLIQSYVHDKTGLTESNYERHKKNSQFLIRNYSMNNYINTTFHNNIDNSIITNNNNVLLIDNNKSTHADRLDPKNAIKINRIKDEYIDFLQKQYEDNNKINFSLDSNNKELLKKCNDLIQDNIMLNKLVNEKTNKLNNALQENKSMKSQMDKALISSKKNEQKTVYYEEQLKLFKSNNENYQKIINDLKEQNYQLNLNLTQIKKTNEEEIKKIEEEYKNKIEETKKDLEESYNEKIQEFGQSEGKIKDLLEEIKELKDRNNDLIQELKNKDNIIDLMYKDNEKLVNQNNLKDIQIEQNTKQIADLNQIIQHKENLINSLKANKESEAEKTFLNKSNSPSIIKLENSDFISENITKLMNDNEENKLKIEYLNDKIRVIRELEKKYNQLLGDQIIQTSSDKTSNIPKSQILSQKSKTTGHTIYISKNTSKNSSRNSSYKANEKKAENQDIKLRYSKQYMDNKLKNGNEANNKRKPIMVNTSFPLKTLEIENELKNTSMRQNDSNERIITDYKDNYDKKKMTNRNNKYTMNFNKNNSININLNKKNRIIELDIRKSYKEKKEKSSDKIRKPEIQNAFNKGRNFFNNENNNNKEKMNIQINDEVNFEEKKTIHGKELDEERDEVKENIRKMKRKKNYTHKPNVSNFSLEENKQGKEAHAQQEEIEYEENNNFNKNEKSISYYLYGIDRNDFLHIFDINKKKWVEKKKIFEIDLDDKSDTFRKDYQYEGTLLYNMLDGVYILTGEKTDTLYFFNSETNSISKICKFNYGHDNGSIMYDENKDFLYVFGGKNSTNCEYYSFPDKKIYKLPNLISDRANGSFIISNNKIFGFFGFSYKNETYVKTIEYIDYFKKDQWIELQNIKFLKKDISFDVESVSTMYYKQNTDKILIYSGIQGEDEEFVTDYYLIYDAKNNIMDKINKWNLNQYKRFGTNWKDYSLKKNDPKGFHFAKNSRFILLPKNCGCEGYNKNDDIDILIDYKNNVHFILQGKEKIDIYRGEI